jgi:beta-glucosidase
LKKGETRKIIFTLDPEQLMLVSSDGKPYQPSGKMVLSVGGGQPLKGIATTSNVLLGSSVIQ